jgi:flagellar hook assembly protein FlgD
MITLTGNIVTTSTDDANNQDFYHLQNHPNPFNESTTISFELKQSDHVQLNLYDANGKFVKCVLNEKRQAGLQNFQYNAQELKSGLYYIELQSTISKEIKKIIRLED